MAPCHASYPVIHCENIRLRSNSSNNFFMGLNLIQAIYETDGWMDAWEGDMHLVQNGFQMTRSLLPYSNFNKNHLPFQGHYRNSTKRKTKPPFKLASPFFSSDQKSLLSLSLLFSRFDFLSLRHTIDQTPNGQLTRPPPPPRIRRRKHLRTTSPPTTTATATTTTTTTTLLLPPPRVRHRRVLGRPMEDVRSTYTFGRELGRGQFGVTYLVTHKTTGEKFACQVNRHSETGQQGRR